MQHMHPALEIQGAISISVLVCVFTGRFNSEHYVRKTLQGCSRLVWTQCSLNRFLVDIMQWNPAHKWGYNFEWNKKNWQKRVCHGIITLQSRSSVPVSSGVQALCLVRLSTLMVMPHRYIENNTWARVDMGFLFHSFAALTRELSSWTREEYFHIYKQPCIILFII